MEKLQKKQSCSRSSVSLFLLDVVKKKNEDEDAGKYTGIRTRMRLLPSGSTGQLLSIERSRRGFTSLTALQDNCKSVKSDTMRLSNENKTEQAVFPSKRQQMAPAKDVYNGSKVKEVYISKKWNKVRLKDIQCEKRKLLEDGDGLKLNVQCVQGGKDLKKMCVEETWKDKRPKYVRSTELKRDNNKLKVQGEILASSLVAESSTNVFLNCDMKDMTSLTSFETSTEITDNLHNDFFFKDFLHLRNSFLKSKEQKIGTSFDTLKVLLPISCDTTQCLAQGYRDSSTTATNSSAKSYGNASSEVTLSTEFGLQNLAPPPSPKPIGHEDHCGRNRLHSTKLGPRSTYGVPLTCRDPAEFFDREFEISSTSSVNPHVTNCPLASSDVISYTESELSDFLLPPPDQFADEVCCGKEVLINGIILNEEESQRRSENQKDKNVPFCVPDFEAAPAIYGDFLINPVSGHTVLQSVDIQCEKISFRGSEQLLPLPRGKSPFLKKTEEPCLSPIGTKDQERLTSLVAEFATRSGDVDDPKAYLSLPLQDLPLVDLDLTERINLDRKSLESSEVIGQIDFKFIAAFDPSHGVVFVVDQHAGHERIKLEELVKDVDCSWEKFLPEHIQADGPVLSSLLSETLSLSFEDGVVARLKTKQECLAKLGVRIKIGAQSCDVTSLPTCILMRNRYQTKEQLTQVAGSILKEVIDFGGECPPPPSAVLSALSSMACHGSVRFGREMSRESCCQLLRLLGRQKLPFQCAHGRPSLVPIVKLPQNSQKKAPSLKKLSMRMKKYKMML